MKIQTGIITIAAALALILSGCGDGNWTWGAGTEEKKYFDYDLRGVWESTDKSVYSGKLEIRYDTVRISGYEESQTPSLGGNDSRRPFREYMKGIDLKGYNEEGKFYISDAGIFKDGIPFEYWYDEPNLERVYFLRFEFGGRRETLRKTEY